MNTLQRTGNIYYQNNYSSLSVWFEKNNQNSVDISDYLKGLQDIYISYRKEFLRLKKIIENLNYLKSHDRLTKLYLDFCNYKFIDTTKGIKYFVVNINQ